MSRPAAGAAVAMDAVEAEIEAATIIVKCGACSFMDGEGHKRDIIKAIIWPGHQTLIQVGNGCLRKCHLIADARGRIGGMMGCGLPIASSGPNSSSVVIKRMKTPGENALGHIRNFSLGIGRLVVCF